MKMCPMATPLGILVMAYIVMAYIVMAYIVMAYIVMVDGYPVGIRLQPRLCSLSAWLRNKGAFGSAYRNCGR